MFKKRLILSDIEKYINSPEALIISGMRRTGKTTLLKHLFNKIKSKKNQKINYSLTLRTQ
jgi:predicted AAA+ superfamily ATPase